MQRLLHLSSVSPDATVLIDDLGSVSRRQFVDGVRVRAGVLFSHVLKRGVCGCICLYVKGSYHAVEVLFAALSLRVKVVVACPDSSSFEVLQEMLEREGDSVVVVADSDQREVMAEADSKMSCFFLDSGKDRSLLGSTRVRGPDLDVLLSGLLAELPVSCLSEDGVVVVHDAGIGLVRSTCLQLVQPILHERLRRSGSTLLFPESGLGRMLGVCLLVQSVLCGSVILLSQSVPQQADLTIPPVTKGLSQSCIVLCEAHEKEKLSADCSNVVLDVVTSHVSEFGMLSSLYKVEDHVFGGCLVCPVSAVLFAALRFGSVQSFLYSRLHTVEASSVLQTKWTRSAVGCSVSVQRPDGIAPLALFDGTSSPCSTGLPSWCTEDMESSVVMDVQYLVWLQERGLNLGESFQLIQTTVELCSDRCRVRLARASHLSVELLNAVLLAPLLMILGGKMLPVGSSLLLLPRKIARAESFSGGGVPTRCFVQRNVASSLEENLCFNVVAIDSNAKMVLKLDEIVFLPALDPLRIETFFVVQTGSSAQPSSWPVKSESAIVLVPDDHTPTLDWLNELEGCKLVECVKWDAYRKKKEERHLVLVASHWSNVQLAVSRLQQSNLRVVVVTDVAQNAQHALFMGLARLGAGAVRVIDLGSAGGVLSVNDFKVLVLQNFGLICHATAGIRSVVLRSSAGGPLAAQSKHLYPVSVVGRGNVADAVLRLFPSGAQRCDMSAVSQQVGGIAVLCGKSLQKMPDSYLVRAFVDSLPNLVHGLILLPVFERGASLSELASIEYCVSMQVIRKNFSCLCCSSLSALDASVLAQAVSGSMSVLRMPRWIKEEEDWMLSAKRSEESSFPSNLVVTTGLSQRVPNFPQHSETATIMVTGWSSQCASLNFPFLGGRRLWDKEAFGDVLSSPPTFASVKLLEVIWDALDGIEQFSSRQGVCFVAGCGSGEVRTLGGWFGFSDSFGVVGCGLRVVTLACSMLRAGETSLALVAACSPSCAGVGSQISRPFDAKSLARAPPAEGAAAVVMRVATTTQRPLIVIEQMRMVRSFRQAQLSTGCALVQADANGSGDSDAAEFAALRRTAGKSLNAIVVDACRGRFGDTGSASALVSLVAAISIMTVTKRVRHFHWFSELNSHLGMADQGAKVVFPVEDVLFSSTDGLTACITSSIAPADQGIAQMVVKFRNSAPIEEPLWDGTHACEWLIHSQLALERVRERHLTWLLTSLKQSLGRQWLPANFKPSLRLVAFGSSKKSLAKSLQRVDASSLLDSSNFISANNVWIGFSPSVAGIKEVAQELMGLCGHDILQKLSIEQHPNDGPCLQLLRYHLLAMHWLVSVIELETVNLLGMGMGTRNAVAAAVSSLSSEPLHELVAACRKDDLAMERLMKRVCVLECFADWASMQKVLQPFFKSAILTVITLGPASCAVVLRSARFASSVEQECRASLIRCCSGSEAVLLWTPSHRVSPLTVESNPSGWNVHDLGTGWWWSDVQSLGSSLPLHELWTHPMSASSPWATDMIEPGRSLLIDLGGGGRSLGMLLKKSAKLECLSMVGRRTSPILVLERLAVSSRIKVRSSIAVRRKISILAPSATFVDDHGSNVEGQVLLSSPMREENILVCLPGSPKRLEVAWMRVVAHHPILRSVVSPKEALVVVVKPADVVASWDGLSALAFEEFDVSVFPRFCLTAESESAARLCISSFGLSEDAWNVILKDWKATAVDENLLLTSSPVLLQPDACNVWLPGGGELDGEETLEWSQKVECEFDSHVQSIESVVLCLKQACPFQAAVHWRLGHAPEWSKRNIVSAVVLFQICCCGCGKIEILSKLGDLRVQQLLATVCQVLTEAAEQFEDRRLLHHRVHAKESMWPQVTRLCDALASVGCTNAGHGVVMMSSSVEDWRLGCMCASLLGLVLLPSSWKCDDSKVGVKACLVDRRFMSQARVFGCPVLIVDAIVNKGEEKTVEEKGSWSDSPIEVDSGTLLSQRDLARRALKIVRRFCVTSSDVILYVSGESLALEFLVACFSGASVSCDFQRVTVCILRTSSPSSLCQKCPNLRAEIAFRQ